MNDQTNPVATDQPEMAAKASERRRLVRGAVALAPLVLTLRSGALAAASCTGARLVRINNNNRIPPNAGVNPTDVCFPDAPICEGHPIGVGPTKINSVPNPHGIALTPHNNGSFSCGTGDLVGKNVAILSACAASSLGFTNGNCLR